MSLFDSMEQLKQSYPVVAEAVELFGHTIEWYNKALLAAQPPQTYLSSGTTTVTPITYTGSSTGRGSWTLL